MAQNSRGKESRMSRLNDAVNDFLSSEQHEK
jgi:hypothetical protein